MELVVRATLPLAVKSWIIGVCVSDLLTVILRVELVLFPAASVAVAVNVTVVLPQL